MWSFDLIQFVFSFNVLGNNDVCVQRFLLNLIHVCKNTHSRNHEAPTRRLTNISTYHIDMRRHFTLHTTAPCIHGISRFSKSQPNSTLIHLSIIFRKKVMVWWSLDLKKKRKSVLLPTTAKEIPTIVYPLMLLDS